MTKPIRHETYDNSYSPSQASCILTIKLDILVRNNSMVDLFQLCSQLSNDLVYYSVRYPALFSPTRCCILSGRQ